MTRDEVRAFARETCTFVNRIDKEGLMDGFIRWGGKMQNKTMNNMCCELAGVDNWWRFCEDKTLTSDKMYEVAKMVKEKTFDGSYTGLGRFNYFLTRLIKTRVAFSDEAYFDSIGCMKNPNKYDQLWDNEIGGIRFDLKNTYVPEGVFFNEYKDIESILKDPSGFIKTLYASSSSKKGGSERGEVGKMNGRFFIVNHSEASKNGKYLIECGYNARYSIFDEVVEKFSDKNVFDLEVHNNSDGNKYNVKCSLLIISQNADGKIEHHLLESK